MLARLFRRGVVAALLVAACVSGAPSHVAAAPAPRARAVKAAPARASAGPGPGRGERKVDAKGKSNRRAASAGTKRGGEQSHKVGRPPRVPRATLPSDAVRPVVSDRVRRAVAGGVTSSDIDAGQDDPELRALAAAERQLFPRALDSAVLERGLPSGLDRPGPTVVNTGLPLAWTAGAAARPEPRSWPEGLSLPNLPTTLEQRTLDYLKFFRDSAAGRSIAESWVRKSGRYVPAIVAELARANMPTDLVWLSLVESGHNPTIRSPKGAAGLWQFVPESARMYGLTVDRWVDERLDPLRSTRAALSFLSDLERRFGSWELAMAAYNMGHHGLMRSIRKYNTNDYWRLSRLEAALPWETALYVPKVLATAIIMRNKAAFGLADIPADPAISFDTVLVPSGVSLASIAASAGVPENVIVSLNPQYLVGRTPPAQRGAARQWAVHVPLGLGKQVAAQLDRSGSERQATATVRFGDTPATIAARLHGTEEELCELNRIRPSERLVAGATLLIPPTWVEGGAPPPREDTEDVVAIAAQHFQYPERERVFYRTLAGDDLESIARAFRVRPTDLAVWNALDERAKLQSDMVLQVFIDEDAELPGVRYAREENLGKRLEVGSAGFYAHFEAEQGRQRLTIRAREGDTLQSIGRRYELSAGTMERINHFSRTRRLSEGAPVVVYAKESPPESEVLLSRAPDPLPPIDPPDPGALPAVAIE